MSVYVPDWLQDTFDRTQRDLAREPRDNLPFWLQAADGTRARPRGASSEAGPAVAHPDEQASSSR